MRGLSSAVIALLAITPAAWAADMASAEDSYVERVQPIIFKNCSGCHTSGGHAGGLTLDSYASLRKGGSRGPAIVPGNPEASILAKAIHYAGDDLRMPPRGKIADADIDAIDKWIRDNPEMAAPKEISASPSVAPAAPVASAPAVRQSVPVV